MNFPFVKSRLKRAIERGLADGKIKDQLKDLGELELKSRTDGEDVCWGLRQLGRSAPNFADQTYTLAGLFQEVSTEHRDAFDVLQEKGTPELVRLFDEISEASADEDANTLMFLLKILGMYGTPAGTLKVIEAARQPLKPDGFMWSVILKGFIANHPEKELLYRSLSEPLPKGFIGISLLDAANAILIEGDSMPHPFDSAEGKRRLRDLLTATDPEEFSYAHSATAALPFISNPERNELLDVAMNHPGTRVRMEAAWAATKVGRSDALDFLAKRCLDFKTAGMAHRYLAELGREDKIPAETKEPKFAAMAEFAQWLEHPNELGEAPDELEVVDHQELRWPPERKAKPFWLIKYLKRDATGLEEDAVECGLVGSMTFCFFSYRLAQRPPEDAYAVHCYWEMEHQNLIEQSDIRNESKEYVHLLGEWKGGPLEKPEILYLAEISPELKYPQRLVGLASARLNGEPGWVVLDGPRSEWYPQAEQPAGAFDSVVLKIHVGRTLLGFTEKPDRKKFLSPPAPAKPPEQIIAAYEKILARAQKAEGKKRKDAFRTYGPLGKHLEGYIDALQQTGRTADIRKVILDLAQNWDRYDGSSKLGTVALRSGQFDLAEEFLKKCREFENYHRSEEMALLAELWCRTGKSDAAKELLLDCLRRLLTDSKTAEAGDKDFFEKFFQVQRCALLKLFPEDAEALMASQSIPASTLSQ